MSIDKNKECGRAGLRCDVCRTINLAKTGQQPKPDMQMYEKELRQGKFECTRPADRVLPTCIKVCSKEEYNMKKSGKKPGVPRMPYYVHGKLMYAVKAGILVGTIYFTYTQGVWGDQVEVTECIRRWQEYFRSINTRRPPTFDHCGNVVKKETVENVFSPAYMFYKDFITTCFSGVAKVPLMIKCAYFDYLQALEKKQEELLKERQIKKS